MFRWTVTLAGAIGLFAASAGCGSSDGDGGPAGPVSCTFSASDGSFTTCQEVTGLTDAQINVWRGACLPSGDAMAVYAADPCSRTNALGGCQQVFGTAALTMWFYADDSLTAADIEMICTESGQTFVAP